MRLVETVHAEPRNVVDTPAYRVNFWQRSGSAWALDAFALTDAADIIDVLHWVHEHAEGRWFEVFAELDDEPAGSFQTPRTTGLVRLLGSNPNSGKTVEMGLFTQD